MLPEQSEHITHQIDAYLDNQLSPQERRVFEAHLLVCPACHREFLKGRQLIEELGPTLRAALGHPFAPPPALRYRLQQQIQVSSSRHFFNPHFWGKSILNAAGAALTITALAAGLFWTIQTQLPRPLADTTSARLTSGDRPGAVAVTPTPDATRSNNARPTPQALSSLGDTLTWQLSPVTDTPAPTPDSGITAVVTSQDIRQDHADTPAPALPEGIIAFSLFNPAPDRQVYEIHFINPDGTNHRLFPLDGVSEPAVWFAPDGRRIAFRAWSKPTSPRSLLSSNLMGDAPSLIGGFWEDAQPDWSPTENRLIFASQRESDRRWRLYTIWGDGSAEKELRREGRSPSFAPDGYRFVFEGCDNTGNRCGLWQANLDNSEFGAIPVLENPQAKAPDWSPVGERIAYMASDNGNWDLFLVNVDGGHLRRLTTHPAIDGLPAWSPDGEWLAFLSNRGGDWGIWRLHVATGELHQVYRFDRGTFTPPAGEPYGERQWWDEQLSWSR